VAYQRCRIQPMFWRALCCFNGTRSQGLKRLV
jgi:hypothetical protein